ncbi:Aste57867_1005 [Aphanomyces stellatus]|uniref:Aste57867_1005 protein n=1 Tax=Aphanomyces stellatus TaxID=120398 RepID=A0A485K553_9STRA|nr:hypothetical protein As57867_001004 [Aphanomyces stellatus]VFT78227.1 Aste57867_1005 [Aphanomyces stellatus]
MRHMRVLLACILLVAYAWAADTPAPTTPTVTTVAPGTTLPATTQAGTTVVPTTTPAGTTQPPATTKATTAPPASTTPLPAAATTPVPPVSTPPTTTPPAAAAGTTPPVTTPSLTTSATSTLTPSLNSTKSPSTNSSATSTSDAKTGFFRADNGAMWGTFAAAGLVGTIIVVVLLRQSNNSDKDDDHDGGGGPSPMKSFTGNHANDPSKKAWSTPAAVLPPAQHPPPSHPPPPTLDTVIAIKAGMPYNHQPPSGYESTEIHAGYLHPTSASATTNPQPRKDSTPMLEPHSVVSQRYSADSDDMQIRRTNQSEDAFTTNEWAVAAGVHKLRPSSMDSDDIGDARMSYASTAMFERDSTASSRYSHSYSIASEGEGQYHGHKAGAAAGKRDSFEL